MSNTTIYPNSTQSLNPFTWIPTDVFKSLNTAFSSKPANETDSNITKTTSDFFANLAEKTTAASSVCLSSMTSTASYITNQTANAFNSATATAQSFIANGTVLGNAYDTTASTFNSTYHAASSTASDAYAYAASTAGSAYNTTASVLDITYHAASSAVNDTCAYVASTASNACETATYKASYFANSTKAAVYATAETVNSFVAEGTVLGRGCDIIANNAPHIALATSGGLVADSLIQLLGGKAKAPAKEAIKLLAGTALAFSAVAYTTTDFSERQTLAIVGLTTGMFTAIGKTVYAKAPRIQVIHVIERVNGNSLPQNLEVPAV